MFHLQHGRLPLVLVGALTGMTVITILLTMWVADRLREDQGGPDGAPTAPPLTAPADPAVPAPAPTHTLSDDAVETDDEAVPPTPGRDEITVPAYPGGSTGEVSVEGETPDVATAALFGIDGIAPTPLEPGGSSAISVTFSNPHDYSIAVTELTVAISGVRAPLATAALPCGIRDFSTNQAVFSRPLLIEPQSQSSLGDLFVLQSEWPSIVMLNSSTNQDGCKGSTIELAFNAQAVQR